MIPKVSDDGEGVLDHVEAARVDAVTDAATPRVNTQINASDATLSGSVRLEVGEILRTTATLSAPRDAALSDTIDDATKGEMSRTCLIG